MKKLSKKLTLAKETLRCLETEFMENVRGAATERSVCVTICATNCGSVCITACGSDCITC